MGQEKKTPQVIKEKIKQIGQSGCRCYESLTWKRCSGGEQGTSETADRELLSGSNKCEQKIARQVNADRVPMQIGFGSKGWSSSRWVRTQARVAK